MKDYPVRFQRQKVIDNFIVDFYCHKARLIIELDGSGHFFEEQMDYDNKRTYFLEKNNLKVLRFTNLEIDKEFYEVCTIIDKEVNSRINNG